MRREVENPQQFGLPNKDDDLKLEQARLEETDKNLKVELEKHQADDQESTDETLDLKEYQDDLKPIEAAANKIGASLEGLNLELPAQPRIDVFEPAEPPTTRDEKKRYMKNLIRVIAALSLITLAGLVHGSWTNRWRPAPALAALASRLDSVPMVLGDGAWTATSRELLAKEVTMTGAAGYLSRVYSKPSNGLQVSVLLLCGLPGDMATHTPEACYPGAGYSLGSSETYTPPSSQPETQVEFRTAIASRSGSSPSVLRLYWGWRGSKGWSAPEEPRWSFASESMLTKIYIVRETAGVIVEPKNDPCDEFLSLLLPQLDIALYSASDCPNGDSPPPSTSATPSK